MRKTVLRRRWPALMSDKVVAEYIDVSSRLIWRMVSQGVFPEPIQLPGAASKRWCRQDVVEWIAWLGDSNCKGVSERYNEKLEAWRRTTRQKRKEVAEARLVSNLKKLEKRYDIDA